MTYSVKEVFYTLQGEGINAGRPAVFCRFAGCNLWSGLEQDRHKASCSFCDTDFVGVNGKGGGKFATARQLALHIKHYFPETESIRGFVVFTGGEPLLQLDTPLIEALHALNFEIAVETNGTIAVPDQLDWICVSPKAGTDLVQTSGHELKLIYPQNGICPETFESLPFQYFLLQALDDPLDSNKQQQHLQQAIAYCKQHPHWRLSIQTHKWLDIP
ncbi:7-carboxy-7-deazaguanine synthase [Candidatus Venteria ishoeyi]|uniref:7-carboxy-7-deazaguanine synthase n=1 Tax=Candidatus Venteria ishoeyi TaxID=1899563 RepID=UPI0025A5F726|nr:7-carboxy-7-deazaguanine synthase [Candidatus Venteria ishoeyi]MDM8547154.1 7-carboxy-7-deazaguanine synthase [Candidatus Venteria ishoeyi]